MIVPTPPKVNAWLVETGKRKTLERLENGGDSPTYQLKGLGFAMIRIVIIALVVLLVWLAGVQAVHFFRTHRIDWTGVAFCIGFVALAFYLRHATGIG